MNEIKIYTPCPRNVTCYSLRLVFFFFFFLPKVDTFKYVPYRHKGRNDEKKKYVYFQKCILKTVVLRC